MFSWKTWDSLKKNAAAKNAPGCVIWIPNQQNDKQLLFLQLPLYDVGYYDSSFMCKWNIKPNTTQQAYLFSIQNPLPIFILDSFQ